MFPTLFQLLNFSTSQRLNALAISISHQLVALSSALRADLLVTGHFCVIV